MNNTLNQHPLSLRTFFATEMWERYGFYVVQTLLALYLVVQFKWNDKDVYTLVASFTALTYLSPLIGGYLADTLIGQKIAIMMGGVILLLSYCLLSLIHSSIGLTSALAGIAVGTGLIKSNISSLLGNEYAANSSKRERGFTIFYMGITSGIILGSTVPFFLYKHGSWSLVFLSAAIGMGAALFVFKQGVNKYAILDYHPHTCELKKMLQAVFILIVCWSVFYLILQYPWLANSAFISVLIASMVYLIYTSKQEAGVQARQTIVIGLLCFISTIFWAFYFQMFLSLTLFISRVVEPTIAGISFPAPYYVGIQSVGMLVFGAFLAKHKTPLNAVRLAIRTGNKFLAAILIMLFVYGSIALICRYSTSPELVSPLYIIPAYVLISLAELLLSPVGLSAVTVLASRKKVSTMMGIFFASLGIGGYLSGKLADITAINANNPSILLLKTHYSESFGELFCILLGTVFVCLMINVLIKRLMRR